MKSKKKISIKFFHNEFCIIARFVNIFLYLIFTTYFSPFYISAQNNRITPKVESFEQLKPQLYYNNSSLQYQTPIQSNVMEATTNDIISQQNRQQMGYTPPVVPPSDPNLQHQFILNQYKQSQNKSYQQHKELLEILNEVHSENNNNSFDNSNYNSAKFHNQTKSFTDALNSLNDMLNNKNPQSISKAYFAIESAYDNTYLSEKEFNNQIAQSANFIKQWLTENGYNPKRNEDLHYGLQKFMKDTLVITIKHAENIHAKTMIHFPFAYDYNDFQAEKDHRNYFITKCLATGTGQCNSLPGTYLAIAEKLGAKTYLIFAPQHSFIKYPDSKGGLHGYEPTSNWKISDKWYVEHLGILPNAIKSGIYLDTLNKQMIIANCMLDLAFGYMKKFGATNGEFVTECINTAMQYYPRKNNITAYFLRSSLLARKLENLLKANGIRDIKDMGRIKGATELYQALIQNEAIIQKLGYQEMPEAMYLDIMQNHEFKGKLQKNINTKQKRNLFSITTN